MAKASVEGSKKKSSLSRSAESKYLTNNKVYIIGVDEAGRGPLAGPVVAAACIILDSTYIDGIMDSKATTESDREATYDVLINHSSVFWSVSIISHVVIDEINILEASLMAMREATTDLLQKLPKKKTSSEKLIALIDGNKVPSNMPIDSQFVIKGDSFVYSIAAASIIAKVTRDRIMKDLDKEYPQYGLAKHKGYPTFEHRGLLMKFGPSPIHRFSYGPVKLAEEAMILKSKSGGEKSSLKMVRKGGKCRADVLVSASAHEAVLRPGTAKRKGLDIRAEDAGLRRSQRVKVRTDNIQ